MKKLHILSLSPRVDNIIVIPKRTKNRMSFPFEDPIKMGWVKGLMNWSMPSKEKSLIPKMIKIMPKAIYFFVFIRLSPFDEFFFLIVIQSHIL